MLIFNVVHFSHRNSHVVLYCGTIKDVKLLKKINRYQFVIQFGGFGIYVILLACLYYLFLTKGFDLIESQSNTYLALICVVLANSYWCSTLGTLIMVFMIIITVLMTVGCCFGSLAKMTKNIKKEPIKRRNRKIIKIIKMHKLLCGDINEINRIFNWSLFASYFFVIATLCLILFILVHTDGEDHSYKILSFLAFFLAIGLNVFLVGSAYMSSLAVTVSRNVMKSYKRDLNKNDDLKVVCFLKRLTGQPVGISCADFIVTPKFAIRMWKTIITFYITLLKVNGIIRKKCQMINLEELEEFKDKFENLRV